MNAKRLTDSCGTGPALSRKQFSTVVLCSLLFFAFLIAALVFLFFLVWQSDTLVRLGLVGGVYYIILVLLGLGGAVILFVALRSYAHYRGRQCGGILELSGPIVYVVLTVGGGFVLAPPKFESFPLTVFVQDEGVSQELVVNNNGYVQIDLDGDRRRETIGDKGQAFFPAVPSRFHDKSVPVTMKLPGFEQTGPGFYVLKGNAVYLTIRKCAQRITGLVQDDSGNPIPNAVIGVSGITANTDATGFFELSIPVDRLKSDMPVQVQAAGYATWHGTGTPGANDLTIKLVHQP